MKVKSMYREYETVHSQSFEFVDKLLSVENRFVVIDQNVLKLYPKQLSSLTENGNCFVVEATEENKTVYKGLEIIDEMIKMKSRRNTQLIAIGGGIVQDVACFVSSVIYRGIDWILVPTTLLAQTDSCIGSKSSINYGTYKNLIGTFYPPTVIYIDTGFLGTLSDKEYFSGIGEILKCSLMRGVDSFRETADRAQDILNRNYDVLSLETQKALEFKKGVIEIDELDRDYRNIMNLGHTFGHAIESATEFAVPHGQGVAIGIIIANEISVDRGLMTPGYRDDIRKTVLKFVSPELLQRKNFDIDLILKYMRKDKKYQGNRHTCILLDNSGVDKYRDVTDAEVEAALTRVKNVACTD